ncbi:recombinase family protein [Mesorhizobium sp. BAC0120]|uniref:recombinase family protein n=1 Tax=Mesorhizobium sp. BAC0120 TaxID=3090670 RepID=UPI00298D2A47|nr:recombinase family protein [Mesorhizobium sp. BAC0120]MDW6021648.1 recombinase family protein [Mesorhizobium sp. BAC0120]
MRKIGYARVSTNEQNLDLQRAALQAAGCVEIHADQGISGSDFERPGLSRALHCLEPGDMLVVWRLDRLGRSLIDLIKLVTDLGARAVEFHSLSEAIDTSSPGGRLLFHMLAAMAEFERSLISERTRAGMAAARARGSRIGRRPATTAAQRAAALIAIEQNKISVEDVAAEYGIHPRTLLRVLRDDQRGNASG